MGVLSRESSVQADFSIAKGLSKIRPPRALNFLKISLGLW